MYHNVGLELRKYAVVISRFWREFVISVFYYAHLRYSRLSCDFISECDEAVALVHAVERVHHDTQIPDLTIFLKQRNQLVLKYIFGEATTEYL